MKIKTGGPAFPRASSETSVEFTNPQDGMTLRDWFAGQVLMGAMANPEVIETAKERAVWAYEVADAMLKARHEM